MSEHQEVDLYRMTILPKCAVICRTEEELNMFFENAKMQIFEYAEWLDSDTIHRMWDLYKENTGFTLFVGSSSTPSGMSYCKEEWFRNEHYEIVEFSDLCTQQDIAESDENLSVLFGGTHVY